jgi:hypothetical protein
MVVRPRLAGVEFDELPFRERAGLTPYLIHLL